MLKTVTSLISQYTHAAALGTPSMAHGELCVPLASLPISLRNVPWREYALIAQYIVAPSPLPLLADNCVRGGEAVAG